MKNNSMEIRDEALLGKIYFIRGQKVMLDRDLAVLFDVKAIRLREQVKRNSVRFPPHFMFQLTKEEVDQLVSQNAIPSHKTPWRLVTIRIYGTRNTAVGKRYYK